METMIWEHRDSHDVESTLDKQWRIRDSVDTGNMK